MNHDDALADALDVAGVVRCQQQRHAVAIRFGAQELSNHRLGRDVKSDRGLVEKQQMRRMQQACGDLAAHALAERQLTHRRVDERAELEERRQRVDPPTVIGLFALVHAAEELEGVAWRQLVPELRALAEHRADAEGELVPLP